MTYKKRTEIAESTALEKRGRRESKMASEPANRVIRSVPKSPQLLGFYGHSILIGEFWAQDHWRPSDNSKSQYALTFLF